MYIKDIEAEFNLKLDGSNFSVDSSKSNQSNLDLNNTTYQINSIKYIYHEDENKYISLFCILAESSNGLVVVINDRLEVSYSLKQPSKNLSHFLIANDEIDKKMLSEISKIGENNWACWFENSAYSYWLDTSII